LKKNQTSPSHATQETTFWVSPHPKKESLLPIPPKKTPLERGEITLKPSPPHPKKPFWKRRKKSLTPHPFFKKLHLQLVILSI